MKYVSTRGRPGVAGLPFCDILLEGLAPDGGLYLPERYPVVDAATLGQWRRVLADEGYAGLAFQVLRLFVDDIGDADLAALCARAYSAERFGSSAVVTVADLGAGMALGRLSSGPTAAFKDLAMQLLGELFEYELERRDERLNILGATSGDTGSAAEHAMLGKERIRVVMLTPRGRMTPFQQAQMFSLDDDAIVNVAVNGVFDDCQDLVKAVSGDLEFKARHRIGAVNSINWARLVAQVVYYVCCWVRVTTSDDQRISFAVPTGNFGNICAGHIAREMGLPIDTLILATNENNVLEEFFRTGVYRVRAGAETLATSSPSMDISKASNFERFLFDLVGRDSARLRALFDELDATGAIDLAGTPEFAGLRQRFGFVAGASTHADRVDTIRALAKQTGTVVDPHTADAVHVARAVLDADATVARPVVVLETALPVKFSATILEALGKEPDRPAAFAGIEALPRHVVDLDNDVDALRALLEERLV